MGDVRILSGVRSGTADVQGPAQVHTVAVRGFVTFNVASDLLRRFDAAIALDPSIRAVVIDMETIEGFEPGIPARIIQWLGANASQITAAVLVTLSPVLTATVRAAALILPNTNVGSATTRMEGQSTAVHLIAQSRPRAQTGTRRSATTLRVPSSGAVRKISG